MSSLSIELADLWLQGSLAIAAFLALRQISITKENFRLNSKRESIKFTLSLIKDFKDLLPIIDIAGHALKESGYKKYNGDFNLKYFSREEVNGNLEL